MVKETFPCNWDWDTPQLVKRTITCIKRPQLFHVKLSKCSRSMFVNNCAIYNQWMTIQDIIGSASLWPVMIRRLYRTRNLNHFQKVLVSAFIYVNGLNPEIFYERVDLQGLARDRAAFNQFRALPRLFSNGHFSTSLYAWYVTTRRWKCKDIRPCQ